MKVFYYGLNIVWIISLACCTQEADYQPTRPADVYEILPVFPGGIDSLNHFMKSNIKLPKEKREGRVYVHLNFNKYGEVVKAESVGDPLGGGYDEAVIAVCKRMPLWAPGKNRGEVTEIEGYTVFMDFPIKGKKIE